MGTIRDKMTADLELRGFASTTKKEYLQRAHNFVAYHRRPPTELGEQEVREFLLYLVNERKTGSETQHMYVAAIKFLYATTLGRPEVVAKVPWPKRPQTLPDILTGAEVERIFRQIASLKAAWIEKRMECVLPTHYFHVVFTLPHEITALAFQNRKTSFNLLFSSAAHTLLELAASIPSVARCCLTMA